MKKGDKAILIPGHSAGVVNGSSAHRHQVSDVLKAMTEVVTIVSPENATGNARVRDNKGMVFYCNPRDLKPYSEYFLELNT